MTVRPLVTGDRDEAAGIYVAGLGDEEVRPMMPHHRARAQAVLADLIQAGTGSWVAESHDGELIGLVLCQEPHGAPPSMVNWRALRRHLPLTAALRAWIVSNYLYRVRFREDALYLQSLVVAESWQGRGVGASLVDFVCNEAYRRGYRAVTLNVVDGNERARCLYERLGFSKVGTTRTGLFKPLVGWAAVDAMEKPLARQNGFMDPAAAARHDVCDGAVAVTHERGDS